VIRKPSFVAEIKGQISELEFGFGMATVRTHRAFFLKCGAKRQLAAPIAVEINYGQTPSEMLTTDEGPLGESWSH